MKKKLHKKIDVFCIRSSPVLIFFLLMTSCNPVVKSIGPFSSSSIEESKKRDVFIWEYEPTNVIIYDSIEFEIKEAFAEKMYYYYSPSDIRYKVSDDDTQIVIKLKDKLSQLGHFELWTVDGFYGMSDNGITKMYDGTIPEDTLMVKIKKVAVNKNGLAGEEDGRVIGSFQLRRKLVTALKKTQH